MSKALFVNAAMNTPLVINVDVVRPVSITLVVVLNRFIFFVNLSRTSVSSNKYVLVPVNFFGRYVC